MNLRSHQQDTESRNPSVRSARAGMSTLVYLLFAAVLFFVLYGFASIPLILLLPLSCGITIVLALIVSIWKSYKRNAEQDEVARVRQEQLERMRASKK